MGIGKKMMGCCETFKGKGCVVDYLRAGLDVVVAPDESSFGAKKLSKILLRLVKCDELYLEDRDFWGIYVI